MSVNTTIKDMIPSKIGFDTGKAFNNLLFVG